jgi:hypothetical protein
MVNYSKTQELFNKEPKKSPDLKYKDTFPAGFFGQEAAEEKWFSQVKNPNTGEFFQLENLKALGILPADFKDGEKPKNYPLKEADTIIRIKKADGTEWLASTQTWTGLDRYGNEITRVLSVQRSMISLTFLINLLKVKVIIRSIMTQIIHFQSLKEWRHLLSTLKSILCLLHLKTWNSYGSCVDPGYASVLRMRAWEIVQIEVLKDMKTLKNHLTSYGNGLLL